MLISAVQQDDPPPFSWAPSSSWSTHGSSEVSPNVLCVVSRLIKAVPRPTTGGTLSTQSRSSWGSPVIAAVGSPLHHYPPLVLRTALPVIPNPHFLRGVPPTPCTLKGEDIHHQHTHSSPERPTRQEESLSSTRDPFPPQPCLLTNTEEGRRGQPHRLWRHTKTKKKELAGCDKRLLNQPTNTKLSVPGSPAVFLQDLDTNFHLNLIEFRIQRSKKHIQFLFLYFSF